MGARPRASAAATPPPSEASSCSSLWSDLPPELAGLVLRRLPSFADRVCFGSVCQHWRHAARQQAPVLPPVLPWTITSCTGTVQTIPDGEVYHLCSSKLTLCYCSSENWLLTNRRASRDDTDGSNFLENPLSGATLPLPGPGNLLHPVHGLYHVTKIIVCPDDNLVIATATRANPPNRDPLIAWCRPGTSSWSTSSQPAASDGYLSRYQDIAFHDQNIYAITEVGDLLAHEVSDGHEVGETPTVVLSPAKLVIKGSDPWCYGVRRFLVVSGCGRLLMVKWNLGWSGNYDDNILAFEVFEANLQMSRWSKLSSIGDQVLFVSRRCSKAVPVSPNHDDYLCRNHIYFLASSFYGPHKCCSGTTSCGMYDLKNNTYHRILSDAFRTNDIQAETWFFPH